MARPAGAAAGRGQAAVLDAPGFDDRPSRVPCVGEADRPGPEGAGFARRCAELAGEGGGFSQTARRPGGHGRPVAAVPVVVEGKSADAAGDGVAEDEIRRAAPGPPGQAVALGEGAGGGRGEDLGSAPGTRREAVGPSPDFEVGEDRGGRRYLSPGAVPQGGAGDPGPRLAGRGPRLRPRPGRSLVGTPARAPAARRFTWRA